MYQSIIDVIRELIVKTERFSPDAKGKTSPEPYNITAFLCEAFGKADPKKWGRRLQNPGSLTLEEAFRISEVVGKPLYKILILAEEREPSLENKTKPDFFERRENFRLIKGGRG